MIECSLSRLNSRQSKEGCEETFLKYVLYAFGNIHVDSNRDGPILFAMMFILARELQSQP